MRDLRDHLVELADAGASRARVPGVQAAIRQGQRRRVRLAAGAVVMVLALLGGVVAVDRWVAGWRASDPPIRPGPPTTTLQPFTSDRWLTPRSDQAVRFVDTPRRLAEGVTKGRHWAFYAFRRHVTHQPRGGAEVQSWQGMVDWETDGRIGGWSSVCYSQTELRTDRMLTLGLDEPVENEVFVYQGWVTKRAARIRFQLTGQAPFEAQRIVDLGPQYPNGWYIAFFSPSGGTRTMLGAGLLTRATVLDAQGRTICTEAFGRDPPPAERNGCASAPAR